jgi:hypothetical protein
MLPRHLALGSAVALFEKLCLGTAAISFLGLIGTILVLFAD